MKKHWPIFIMLTTIALQGGGLLQAIHLAEEHCSTCEQNGASLTASPNCEDNGYYSAACWSPQSHGHFHDPATCRICQMLAHLEALTVFSSSSLIADVLPIFRTPMPGRIRYSRDQLPGLVPRAPPETPSYVSV